MKRIPFFLYSFLLLALVSCEKEKDNVSPAATPEEFSMMINGFKSSVVAYEVAEESSDDVIEVVINKQFNPDRMHLALRVPASLSHSGYEESLEFVLWNKLGESPWENVGTYPFLTVQQQSYEEERFAIMSYIIDDDDNTYYDSDRIAQVLASIEITSVDDSRIKGSFAGQLQSPSGNSKISVSGSFNAKLPDDL